MTAKKVLDLSVFVVSNVIINLVDVVTDGITAYALCEKKIKYPQLRMLTFYFAGGIHVYWSGLTIFWIFVPFILHFSIIIFRQYDRQKAIREVFLHFPLGIPIKNAHAAYQLYKVEYTTPMPVASIKKIEEIKMAAGNLTQGEAFMVC